MGGMLLLCLGKMRAWFSNFGLAKLLALALVVLSVAAVLTYASWRLASGFEERVESSWGLRRPLP